MKKIMPLILFFMTITTFSQIVISENFNVSTSLPSGWTQSRFSGTTVQSCEGNSFRTNLRIKLRRYKSVYKSYIFDLGITFIKIEVTYVNRANFYTYTNRYFMKHLLPFLIIHCLFLSLITKFVLMFKSPKYAVTSFVCSVSRKTTSK